MVAHSNDPYIPLSNAQLIRDMPSFTIREAASAFDNFRTFAVRLRSACLDPENPIYFSVRKNLVDKGNGHIFEYDLNLYSPAVSILNYWNVLNDQQKSLISELSHDLISYSNLTKETKVMLLSISLISGREISNNSQFNGQSAEGRLYKSAIDEIVKRVLNSNSHFRGEEIEFLQYKEPILNTLVTSLVKCHDEEIKLFGTDNRTFMITNQLIYRLGSKDAPHPFLLELLKQANKVNREHIAGVYTSKVIDKASQHEGFKAYFLNPEIANQLAVFKSPGVLAWFGDTLDRFGRRLNRFRNN